jgi:hypothetical protein
MAADAAYRIVILGGYGQFGGRIVRWLARKPGLQLIVAGRRLEQAEQLVSQLAVGHGASGTLAQLSALALDADAPDFAARIAALHANLLIHTAGPFDDRTYRVARACIAAGVNYIDLADNREFVLGIGALGDEASSKGLLVVSGASTVPAVSAAIVDHYRSRFGRIDAIDIGITPGSRAPRGLSTIESTLSYCGKRFRGWRGGQWRDVHGWQDLHPVRYPTLGTRWFANCDIPDLQLFPDRYAVTGSVKFSAALELRAMQFSVWAMSWISRAGIVSDWVFAAATLKRLSDPLSRFGSDLGGMHVHIDGLDTHGKPHRLRWFLIAGSGDGPMIPCIASIVLARKLARGQLRCSGARQCVDMLTLEEFQFEVRDLDIRYVVEP